MVEDYKDKDKLKEYYYEKGKTLVEMTEIFGCSTTTISNWMDKYGLDRDVHAGPWNSKDKLEKLYVEEKKSIPEIADEWDCSHGVIWKWMDRHGIDRRSFSEAHVMSALKYRDIAYYINQQGYVIISTEYETERFELLAHRLLAVAKYGIEAIEGMHVHHKNHIPWLNYEDNIELLTPEDHARLHANQSAWESSM